MEIVTDRAAGRNRIRAWLDERETLAQCLSEALDAVNAGQDWARPYVGKLKAEIAVLDRAIATGIEVRR